MRERRPDLVVEHIGSTSVPGLPGKGIVDLSIETEPDGHPGRRGDALRPRVRAAARPGPVAADPADARRLAASSTATQYRIHLHVQPLGGDFPRDLAFRDALRNDPELRRQYEGLKRGITDAGPVEGLRYTHSKTAWILQVYRRLGFAPPPIAPPSTIGILGGGQLGRMLALAGRELGYRIVGAGSGPGRAGRAASPTGSRSAAYDDVGRGPADGRGAAP